VEVKNKINSFSKIDGKIEGVSLEISKDVQRKHHKITAKPVLICGSEM
jgi:hypothetical protein